MSKPVILTGIRSNEEPTIGNYLGAFLPMVELQNKFAGQYQVNMFVPDLHSFTTPIDHTRLYASTIKNLKYFIAAGLDITNPDLFIYRQSFVPAHSELTWILDCFTYIGELNRMTQFKDKAGAQDFDKLLHELVEAAQESNVDISKLKTLVAGLAEATQHEASVSVGLYNYPVLMAADILLYGATYVPVGEDQRQHLELTRDVATRFNNKFGEVFVVPKDWKAQLAFASRDNGIRIRSLRHPEKKMSKSVADPSGTILMNDDPFEAAKKVLRAETDSFGEIKFNLTERPGISNLLQMLALLTERPQADVNAEWEGKSSYGDLKKAVAAAVESFLVTFQTKLAVLDDATVLNKLKQDEAAMNEVANATLAKVQKAVGLRA